ncbi:hypothetical protein GCM10009761_25800 [Agromyces terreus]
MPRTSAPTAPHREFFQAVGLEEKVEAACTCSRGVDHWYTRPGGPVAPAGGAKGDRITARPRRSPAPAAPAS